MAPSQPSGPSDPTFTSYSSAQAASYAAERRTYPDELNKTVIEHHKTTGGEFNLVLDVGCGPGNATQLIAPFFASAIGADPSRAMIEAATKNPSPTSTPDAPMRYVICSSESLSTIPGLEPESVDLLTAGTAAHWFDMTAFWREAAKVVKPGGTVAIWSSSSWYCHPHTTPNATTVQSLFSFFEDVELAPYEMPGNRISRALYTTLPLPWQISPPLPAFAESDYTRTTWNEDGKVAVGERFMRQERFSLAEFARGVATASMVTRWREANPELAGTEKDVVNVAMEKIRRALGEGLGREVGSDEKFEGGCAMVLLVFKKGVDGE